MIPGDCRMDAIAGADSTTRFKELTRIEAAIEHKDKAEVQWALLEMVFS